MEINFLNVFLEICKYVIPALIVFLITYLTLQKFLDNFYEQKMLEYRQKNKEQLLPVKVQAYERLTIFLERLDPTKLLPRMIQPTMSATAFKTLLINTVFEEFNHNIAQQLYVSPQAWSVIKVVKGDVLRIITESCNHLDKNASAADLQKAVMEEIIRREEVPTDKAIDFLKKEFKLIFDF